MKVRSLTFLGYPHGVDWDYVHALESAIAGAVFISLHVMKVKGVSA